jgi:hypothetical protein
MAFRMSSLARTKSGAYKARIGIPKDVREDYRALYGKSLGRTVSPASKPSAIEGKGGPLRVGGGDRKPLRDATRPSSEARGTT